MECMCDMAGFFQRSIQHIACQLCGRVPPAPNQSLLGTPPSALRIYGRDLPMRVKVESLYTVSTEAGTIVVYNLDRHRSGSVSQRIVLVKFDNACIFSALGWLPKAHLKKCPVRGHHIHYFSDPSKPPTLSLFTVFHP